MGAAILAPDSIDSLITTAEAATLCGVTAETIRVWVHRGILSPAGLSEKKRNLYRLIDVAKAERMTRDKARRT